jgi:hypothetical protein
VVALPSLVGFGGRLKLMQVAIPIVGHDERFTDD